MRVFPRRGTVGDKRPCVRCGKPTSRVTTIAPDLFGAGLVDTPLCAGCAVETGAAEHIDRDLVARGKHV